MVPGFRGYRLVYCYSSVSYGLKATTLIRLKLPDECGRLHFIKATIIIIQLLLIYMLWINVIFISNFLFQLFCFFMVMNDKIISFKQGK